MNYAQILKWAAGAEVEVDRNSKYDAKALVDLIDLHNLSGRFLYRIEKENPDWVTSYLLKKLKLLHASTKRKVSRNINALRKLQNSLSDAQVVTIKGVSSFVLSGNEEIMRAGDIDILSDNSSEVINMLTDWRYKLTKAPFMHEIGEYSKRGIEFDIHEYFPVYSYSQKLKSADLLHFNQGVMKNDYNFTSRRIEFSDFYKYVLELNNKPNIVNVTDPNLLAIVICAHAFMNYTNMWSVSHRKKVYVRLSEIADVVSLTQLHDFRTDKFLSYVKRFNAYDSVEWFAAVSQALYGKNLLPVKANGYSKKVISGPRFPRCIWWNFWIGMPENPNDLLFPNWISVEKIIEHTGSNIVPSATHVDVSTINNYFSKNNKLIDANLYFENKGKFIIVKIKLEKLKNSLIDRIRIDFGKYALEWEIENKSKTIKVTGDNQILSSFSDDDNTHNVLFKVNIDKLGQPKSGRLPMLVGIARHNSIGKISTSQLYPIQVKI